MALLQMGQSGCSVEMIAHALFAWLPQALWGSAVVLVVPVSPQFVCVYDWAAATQTAWTMKPLDIWVRLGTLVHLALI